MMSKNQYPPPRKGPNVEAELESLYRRRMLLERLIRDMKTYARVCGESGVTSRRAA